MLPLSKIIPKYFKGIMLIKLWFNDSFNRLLNRKNKKISINFPNISSFYSRSLFLINASNETNYSTVDKNCIKPVRKYLRAYLTRPMLS